MLSTIRNLRGTMTALYGIPYQDSSEKGCSGVSTVFGVNNSAGGNVESGRWVPKSGKKYAGGK